MSKGSAHLSLCAHRRPTGSSRRQHEAAAHRSQPSLSCRMLAPAAAAQGRLCCQYWHPAPFAWPPHAPVISAGRRHSVAAAAEAPERSSRGGRGGRSSSSGRGRGSRGRSSSGGARGGGRGSRGGGSSAGWQRAAAWDSDDDDDDEDRGATDAGARAAGLPDRPASRGRGGGRGSRLPPILRPSSSSVRRGGSSSSNSGSGTVPADSGDFVVVGRASGRAAGAYIPAAAELAQIKQGGSFWESALADEDEDDEDEELDEDDDDGYDVNDESALADDDDLEVAFEDIASLMQELAAGLEGGEGEDPAAAAWRQVYTGRRAPPLCLGPLAVRSSSGKGRGLFTTSPVAAGALLLVAAPLALLYCGEGTTPEIEDLADALASAVAASSSSAGGSGGLAPWQQHALLQLRPAGDSGAAGEQQALPSLRWLLGPAEEVTLLQQEAAATSDTQQEAAASGTQQQAQLLLEAQQQQQQEAPPASLPSKEQLTQLVFANCNGEEGDDEALMLLRGTASSGHLGVWPAAALINHSCSPNCHALLIGDRLVVRAAVDLAAGVELSLSYLGPLLFAPAATRQAELQQQWGFACNCPRCKAEARYTSSLSPLLGEVYAACQAAEPQLQAAVEAEDSQALAGLRGGLQQLQQQLEGALRAAKPPANVRRWLQASVYDLYDLLSLCADQLPQLPAGKSARPAAAAAVETEALAACARIVGATAPGSSAHVDLATEYMVRAEARFGDEHQEAVDATRLCAAATTARYGPCSDGLLQLLMDTRAGAALLSAE